MVSPCDSGQLDDEPTILPVMRLLCILAVMIAALFFTGCNDSNNGHYLPVSSNNAVFLVDTQTGKMYNLPPQYHEGTEPKKDVPVKWKLAAEF
jgi:hypothetical protein